VCDIRFKNAEEGIKKLIMEAIENNTYYPHIKMETKNKHEYIISNFSVWRKV